MIRNQMTIEQVAQPLRDGGLDVTIRDLGSSGGGDWAAVQIDLNNGDFILITPDWGPWDFNDDEEKADRLLAYRYAAGDYEDEGDRPWVGLTDLHTDERLAIETSSDNDIFDATVSRVISQVAALANLVTDWATDNA